MQVFPLLYFIFQPSFIVHDVGSSDSHHASPHRHTHPHTHNTKYTHTHKHTQAYKCVCVCVCVCVWWRLNFLEVKRDPSCFQSLTHIEDWRLDVSSTLGNWPFIRSKPDWYSVDRLDIPKDNSTLRSNQSLSWQCPGSWVVHAMIPTEPASYRPEAGSSDTSWLVPITFLKGRKSVDLKHLKNRLQTPLQNSPLPPMKGIQFHSWGQWCLQDVFRGKFHLPGKKNIPPRKTSRSRHQFPARLHYTVIFFPPSFPFPPFFSRQALLSRLY